MHFVSKNQVCPSTEEILWISKLISNDPTTTNTFQMQTHQGERHDKTWVTLLFLLKQLHQCNGSKNRDVSICGCGLQKSAIGLWRLRPRFQHGCVFPAEALSRPFHLLAALACLSSWPLFTFPGNYDIPPPSASASPLLRLCHLPPSFTFKDPYNDMDLPG